MNGTNRNWTRTKANLNVNKTLKICHFRHLISIFEKLLTWGKILLFITDLHVGKISKNSLNPTIKQKVEIERIIALSRIGYPGIAYSSQANRKIIWSDLCKNVIFLCNTELHIWWSHWHDKTWKWWRKLCGIFQKPFRFLDSKNSKRLQLE